MCPSHQPALSGPRPLAAQAYHSVMRNQSDFIDALRSARQLSREMSDIVGTKVFPYSVFYVFFEQYLSIFHQCGVTLGLALASTLLVCGLLVGSFAIGAIITVTVAMIVIDLAGVMYLWDIALNGVSLTNLVIGVGIGVEFCAHVARAFFVARCGAPRPRQSPLSNAVTRRCAQRWADRARAARPRDHGRLRPQRNHADQVCGRGGAQLCARPDLRGLLFPDVRGQQAAGAVLGLTGAGPRYTLVLRAGTSPLCCSAPRTA